MAEDKFRMSPDVCSYTSDDNRTFHFEISLPGVKKEDIHLKLISEGFSLTAPGKDCEYVSALSFCCPVEAEKAEANYENGCLKVAVPFKTDAGMSQTSGSTTSSAPMARVMTLRSG